MYKVVDLFSGIGGWTLALQEFMNCQTTMFCDIDVRSQSVLRARMKEGKLPQVPIHHDVTTLHLQPGECDILTAGFPCQGFSVIGSRQGTQNASSALVSEVFRLIEECQPSLVCLENVRNITYFDEYNDLIERIGSFGYTIHWCSLKASQLNAPHRRPRWFALCIRHDVSEFTLYAPHGITLYDWSTESMNRMCHSTEACRDRLFLLGNTLVPDCAKLSILYLLTGRKYTFRQLLSMKEFTLSTETHPQSKRMNPEAHDGTYHQGTIQYCPSPKVDLPIQRRQYTFDPQCYISDLPKKISNGDSPSVTSICHKPLLGTPRCSSYNPNNHLTKRSVCDLQTQLRFEIHTESREGIPNPTFIEWMQGYPKGWTEVVVVDQ
jgi:DNA-cytosine methyltransferase